MADKKKRDSNSSEPDAPASSRSTRDMGSSSQGDGAAETDRNARSGTVESGKSPGAGSGDKGGSTGNR